MSDPLLNVMKIMLLAGLYLFFIRVLWAVYNELRDPRTRVKAQPAPVNQPTARRSSRREKRAEASARSTLAASAPSGAHAPMPAPAASAVDVLVGQVTILEPAAFAGVSYALGNELTIGRGHECGIVLDDGYVSTVHARIFHREGSFFIEDLGSRNGSRINGAPLQATTQLEPGDQLTFGSTVVEFS